MEKLFLELRHAFARKIISGVVIVSRIGFRIVAGVLMLPVWHKVGVPVGKLMLRREWNDFHNVFLEMNVPSVAVKVYSGGTYESRPVQDLARYDTVLKCSFLLTQNVFSDV